MIVVAIIGLLAAIAIPNFVRARTTSQTNACINNLRQIDGAAQTWALENNKAPGDTYALADLTSYLGRGSAGGASHLPGQRVLFPRRHGRQPSHLFAFCQRPRNSVTVGEPTHLRWCGHQQR